MRKTLSALAFAAGLAALLAACSYRPRADGAQTTTYRTEAGEEGR